MSERYLRQTLACWLLLLVLLGGVAACSSKAAGRLQAWIDSPADGATVPAGLPAPVACRATAPKGLAEVLLSVDGAPYRSMPVAGEAAACAVTIDWLPAAPGSYTLQVTAYDKTGAGSSPAAIIVKVEGTASVEPTGTPPAEATATETLAPAPDATATPTAYVQPGAPTPTPEPSITPTPFPTPRYWMSVAPSRIRPGECATLQWHVENAAAVYLDGEEVAGEGSKKVCPTETTTYALHIEAPSGNRDPWVRVDVQDETAPPIPKPKSPGDGQTVRATRCPTKLTLEWLAVTDPSGVEYQVQMMWSDGGVWRDVGEWGPITGTTHTVGLECSKAYRWRVRARDGAGNVSGWSTSIDFKLVGP